MAKRKNRPKIVAKPNKASKQQINHPQLGITDAKVAVMLAVLVAVSYFSALSGGFVWDDAAFNGDNVIKNWHGLWDIWLAPSALANEGHYWPVLYSTFWLEHKLWGFAPFGYHLVNLLLHFTVSFLLWRLLLQLAVPGAVLAVAIFALHPVHVESVAWIIGRKDVLATLFYLATLLLYIRFANQRRYTLYFLALLLFTISMLSKTTSVTLPVALLIWHWWKRPTSAAELLAIAPFLLLGVGIALADSAYYKSRENIIFTYTMVERAGFAARSLWFYVGQLLWPSKLAVIYPRWDVGASYNFYLATAATVPVILWWQQRRWGRGWLAGLAFFVLALSPTLSFVDFGFMQFSFVADRYQYLASIAPIAAFSAVLAIFTGKIKSRYTNIASTVLVAPALALLGFATFQQCKIYRSNDIFYSFILSHNPTARLANYNLGRGLYMRSQHQKAIAYYEAEIRNSPDYIWSYIGLGIAHLKLGKHLLAQQNFQDALQLYPNNDRALEGVGAALINQQRHQDALPFFQKLTKLHPNNAKYQYGASVVFTHLGRNQQAKIHLEKALQLNPNLTAAKAALKLMKQAK